MDKQIANKNNCINFLKGCACFGVLYMHTNYDCMVSSIIACLSRFAILIFFMVSGYYCFDKNRELVNCKLPRKIRHICNLCIVYSVVYFLWQGVIEKILLGVAIDFFAFVTECFSKQNILRFLLFNQLPFGGILWFLFALLYCYLIYWIINKYNWYFAGYISIPVLIVIHIVSRGYIQYNGLIDENINIMYYRNFLFMGFPFFMMGNFIHRYERRIINKFSNKALLILIGFGLLLSCVERFVVVLELFWGTVIATFCMFVFAIKNPEKKGIPIITIIGEKYSMQIYTMQLIVNTVVFCFKKAIGIEQSVILAVLNPFIIFAIIPMLVFIFEKLKNFLKKEVKFVERK